MFRIGRKIIVFLSNGKNSNKKFGINCLTYWRICVFAIIIVVSLLCNNVVIGWKKLIFFVVCAGILKKMIIMKLC